VRDSVTGDLYFIVWYADQERLFITPKSVVFIGKNLGRNEVIQGNRDIDHWYFQDATSYCVYGASDFSEPFDKEVNRETIDAEVAGRTIRTKLFPFQEDELHEVVNCEGLARALFECMKRRAKPHKST
jgi:hypothetical protein